MVGMVIRENRMVCFLENSGIVMSIYLLKRLWWLHVHSSCSRMCWLQPFVFQLNCCCHRFPKCVLKCHALINAYWACVGERV